MTTFSTGDTSVARAASRAAGGRPRSHRRPTAQRSPLRRPCQPPTPRPPLPHTQPAGHSSAPLLLGGPCSRRRTQTPALCREVCVWGALALGRSRHCAPHSASCFVSIVLGAVFAEHLLCGSGLVGPLLCTVLSLFLARGRFCCGALHSASCFASIVLGADVPRPSFTRRTALVVECRRLGRILPVRI